MKRIIPLVLLLSLLGGCGITDYRELDQLELIETIGVDRSGASVTVTASGASRGAPTVLKSEATTVNHALKDMQNYTARKYVFYGHTRQFLIGEEAAKQGLDFCLEYMERGAEMRLGTGLYLVKGGTAERAVAACGRENEGIGKLLDSLEKDVQLTSESHVFCCGDISEWLLETGSGIVAAIELTEEDHIVAGESPITVQSAGYGIFTEGKLCGYLDKEQAKAVNLLRSMGGGDTMEIADGAGGFYAVRLLRSKARFEPHYENGSLQSLRIRLKLSCSIEEIQHEAESAELPALLERKISELEAERVRLLTEKMKELDSDFLHIGKKIRAADAKRYDQFGWNVAACNYVIEVETEVERSYEIRS